MLKNKVLTWLNLTIMAIYTIPVTYSIWFVSLFNKYTKIKYYIAQTWVSPWMWAARAKTTFIKNFEYKKNEPYVVISNHLSNLDSMLLFRFLKIKLVFMAKKEVYKLPVFKTAARSFNFIKVDRSIKNDNENINSQARNLFKNGWSLMVYPQGTRAQKENFLPFKSGAFHIALENNVPILPVVIAGTGDIWPKGSKFMKSGKAIINTLDPIDITKYTKDTIDELVFETQEKMAKVYKELTDSIK